MFPLVVVDETTRFRFNPAEKISEIDFSRITLAIKGERDLSKKRHARRFEAPRIVPMEIRLNDNESVRRTCRTCRIAASLFSARPKLAHILCKVTACCARTTGRCVAQVRCVAKRRCRGSDRSRKKG